MNKQELREYHKEWRRNRSAEEREGKEVDDKSFRCKYCDQVIGMRGITIHMRMHGVDSKKYIAENLDDFRKFGWTECEVCGVVTKGVTCSKECKGKYLSEKYKENPSFTGTHSDETLELISQKAKERLKDKTNHPRFSVVLTEETKKKISEAQRRNAQQPDYVNPMQGKTHSPETIKKIIRKRSHTSAEQAYADYLDSQGIDYIWQYFVTYEGKTYAYDFYLKDSNTLVEVDGDYWHGGPGTDKHFYLVESVKRNDKRKDEIAHACGYSINRVWESTVKELL